MKMIAAIVAALAAVLGAGAVLADSAQAANEDWVPAIWPGQYDDEGNLSGIIAGDTTHQFGEWETLPRWETRYADWAEDNGYKYWLDQTGGNWFTVLDVTQVEINGIYHAFRAKYNGPVTLDEDLDDIDVQIEFYNYIEALDPIVDQFYDDVSAWENTVSPGFIQILGMSLDSAKTIETPVGTVYLDGLKVRMTINFNGEEESGPGSGAVSKVVFIPVIVEKLNLSAYDAEFSYAYNGLVQTPLSWLGGDNSDASTPYVHADDCFELPDLEGVVSEDEWVIEGVTEAKDTNKYAAALAGSDAVEAYIVKISAPGNELVNSAITVTWWIMPLGFSDIDFDIKDPYYNFDQEVRPKIVMTWTEPEDGPNGAKVHYILPSKVDITYTMPENYPYEMPFDLVPAYEYELDESGEIKMEQAKDENGDPITRMRVDEEGNPVYVQAKDAQGNPISDDDGNPVYVQAKDENGDPLEEQLRDENGNLVYRYVPGDEPVEIHDRYSDLSYMYNQLVSLDDEGNPCLVYDENGAPVYDMGSPKMTTKMNGEDVLIGKYVPVMVPVYECETDPVMVPVYKLDENGEKIPVKIQALDQYGRPMYEKFMEENRTDWNGNIVYEQKIVDGKLVDDTSKPVMVPVYETVYEMAKDENGEFIEVPLLDANGEPVVVDDEPVMTPYVQEMRNEYDYGSGQYVSRPVYDGDEPVYRLVLGADGQPIQVPKYDETSEKVMTGTTEKVPVDFTATQVGVPLLPDMGYRFDYGAHIVADTGFYEFDTDDYRPAADSEGVLRDSFTSIPLYKPEEAIVDDEFKAPYRVITGEAYDASRFVWNILPLPLENEWLSVAPQLDENGTQIYRNYPVDFEYTIVEHGNKVLVPSAYDSEGNPVSYVEYQGKAHVEWDYDLRDYVLVGSSVPLYKAVLTVPAGYVNPDGEVLAEDYAIAGPYEAPGFPACQYVVTGDGLMQQFMAVSPLIFSDFTDALEYTNLNHIRWGLWSGDLDGMELSVDTVVVSGSVSVEDIKKGIHLYPAYYSDPLKALGPESFLITVVDSSGDLVIDHDVVIRNSMNSDSYRIYVYGNLDAGYFGYFEGEFNAIVMPVPAEGFEYRADPDYRNGLQITGYTGEETDLVIPDRIDGKKVTSIGAKAFYGNKDLVSVKIGDNVRKIHDKAFANCTGLESVDFSDSVQVIGAYAFYNDKVLERIAFGHGLKAVRANAFSVGFASFDVDVSSIAAVFEALVALFEDPVSENLFKSHGYSFEDLLQMDDRELIDALIEVMTLPVDHKDGSGKTQYDVSKLVGNVYLPGEDAKVLEKLRFPPISAMLGMQDASAYFVTCVFGQVIESASP